MVTAIPKDIKASLYIDGKPAEQSIKAVSQVTRTLERELNSLTIGTEEFNKKLKEVAANKKYLKELKDEVNGVGGAFNKLKAELGSLGTLAAGYLGFEFVSSQFQSMIANNAKVSDSLADLRRVIGLNEEEVRGLDKALKAIDTRTSTGGLREIAIIAGKLGVAKNDIVAFTKATDMLVVALGDELGSADQITTQLGKILNVFDGKVTGDNITELGNAMVKLANDGVASAGFIADFTQRVSGIAKTANLSLGATVGLAAGLEELGARSESSSTAMQKLLTDIGGDLPKAAKFAKMNVAEFSQLFAAEPQEALLRYAEGLTKNKVAFSEVSKELAAAGEEGARSVDVITKLGQKGDFLRGKIESGTKALRDNTEITEAFRLKNETLGSTLDKISKWFAGIATSPVVTGALTTLANGFANLVGITKRHSQELEIERMALNKMEFQIISVNTKSADRIKLIEELKSKYPQLLSFLNAEKATNLDIAKAIRMVNDELVNKIILAKADEKIDEENKKRAEIRMQRLNIEDKIREKLVKVSAAFPEFKLVKDGTMTEAQILNDLLGKIIDKRNKLGQVSGGIFDKSYGAGALLFQYNRVVAAENESTRNTGLMEQNRKELKEKLGIKDAVVPKDKVINTPAVILPPSGLTTEQQTAAENAKKQALAEFEKLDDEYKKLNLQRLNDQLSANEKEVKQEADKYQALIDKEKEFLLLKGATPEQKKKTEDNITQLGLDKGKAEADLRVRQEVEMIRKIEDLHIQLTQIQENELQKQKTQINKFYDEQERLNAGNDKAIALLKIKREQEIAAAVLRTKEALQKDIDKIENKETEPQNNKQKLDKKLLDIKIAYDNERNLLKAKYGGMLELEEEYQAALAIIQGRERASKQAATDAFNKANADDLFEITINTATQASDATFQIIANSRRANLDRDISALEQKRKAELDNTDLTEQQRNEINKKYDEQIKQEKLRAWKAEQKAALAQVVINGAVAVTKALAQVGPLGAFVIPSIIAGTLLQSGVILSQKPPEYAEGGMSNENPSGYVSKATIFNNSASGRPFVAGEKGKEWIAPNWMVNSPRFANIIGTLEVARKEKRMFASGGFNDSSNSTPTFGGLNFDKLEALITASIGEQRASIAEQRRFNSLPIVNVYADKEEYERKLERDRARQMA